MNILIIGASGYIGSRVGVALSVAGHQVTALRRPGGSETAYQSVEGDLADPAGLTPAARGYDRVIHVGGPIDDETDLAGADALIASGSPVVYTTGAAVLGQGSHGEDSAPDDGADRGVVAARSPVARCRAFRVSSVSWNSRGCFHRVVN